MGSSEFKGMLIEEYQGWGAKNKVGAVYVKILPLLMFVPVILMVVLFAALDLIDYIGAGSFAIVLSLFILGVVGAIMVLDHSLGRSYTMISIYTNGLDMRPSFIERLRKIPGFVPRGDIEKVSFHSFGNADLKMRDGRIKRLGSRGEEEAVRMAEVLRSRLQINVDATELQSTKPKNQAVKMPKAVPAIAVGDAFCNGCGSRLDMEEAFCSQCGRKR